MSDVFTTLEQPVESNLSQTADKLRDLGYPITRQYLSVLVLRGNGPPTRAGKGINGRRETLIQWTDATTWAELRYPNGVAIRPGGGRKKEELGDDPTYPLRMMRDQIIMWLRDNNPERWKQIMQLPKEDRLYVLNEIADATLDISDGLFCRSIE